MSSRTGTETKMNTEMVLKVAKTHLSKAKSLESSFIHDLEQSRQLLQSIVPAFGLCEKQLKVSFL